MDRKYLEGDEIAKYDSPTVASMEFNKEAPFTIPYSESDTTAEKLIMADTIPYHDTTAYPADEEQVSGLNWPGQENSNPMIPVTTALEKPLQSIPNSVTVGDYPTPILFAEEYPGNYSDPWLAPTVQTSESAGVKPLFDECVDTRRPPRFRLDTYQQNILEAYYQLEKKPDKLTRQMISHRTSLPVNRVSIWFQNRRARGKKRRLRK